MDVSVMKDRAIKNPLRAAKIYNSLMEYKTNRRRREWEKTAEKAARYYYGDQWGAADKRKMKRQRRAPAVFNRILPAIDLLVGHQLQGRVDLVAKPVDEFSDVMIASFITACIKNIEHLNNISLERRFQVLDGLITGIGVKEIYWDTSDYIEGEIRSVQGAPWHYFLDPDSEKYQYTDGHKVFKETWMPLADVKRTYPKAAKDIHIPTDTEMAEMAEHVDARSTWDSHSTDYDNRGMGLESPDARFEQFGYDRRNDYIRVIEQYEMVYEDVEIVYDMATKEMRRLNDMVEEEQEIFKDFAMPRTYKHIHLTTLVGMDCIAVDEDLEATEFYHLFNFYYPYYYNGRIMGVVENLMYPQDEINKRHSQIIHILNTFANSGMFYETGTFPDHVKAQLDDLIARNGATIEVNEGMLDRKEQIHPHDVPVSLKEIILHEKEDIKEIAGAPDEMQGIGRRAQSGAAKEREIQQGAVKLSGIIENFRETQRLEGMAYIHWIQNHYDEERMIRILGEEGNIQTIEINKRAFDKIFNDVTIGKYDITLEFEGKTQSERDRNKWMLIELMKMAPGYEGVIAPEIIRLSDVSQKDKLLQQMEQQRQMMQQQQQQEMMMGMQQSRNSNRGSVRSAARPSRGVRRNPALAG